MADAQEKYPTYTTAIGRLVYPHLNKPRDYKGNGQFAFDTGLVLTGEEAEKLAQFVDEQLEESARINKKKKTHEPPYLVNTDKDGNEIDGETRFKFKVQAVTKTKSGKLWHRDPVFIDSAGQTISEPPILGGGTEARIAFQVYHWANPAGAGVTLQPTQVQIVKLVEGTLDGVRPAFGAVEGGYVAPERQDDDGDDGEQPATGDAGSGRDF